MWKYKQTLLSDKGQVSPNSEKIRNVSRLIMSIIYLGCYESEIKVALPQFEILTKMSMCNI